MLSSPFLHDSPNALARSSVASDVCKAGMISTSFLHDQPYGLRPYTVLGGHHSHLGYWIEEMYPYYSRRTLQALRLCRSLPTGQSSSSRQLRQGYRAGIAPEDSWGWEDGSEIAEESELEVWYLWDSLPSQLPLHSAKGSIGGVS
jgi:hypothetical protein